MRGLSTPILRGILLATVGLVVIIGFLRIDFRRTPQVSPAWTPTEAQRIKPPSLPEQRATPKFSSAPVPDPRPVTRRAFAKTKKPASATEQVEQSSVTGRPASSQVGEQAQADKPVGDAADTAAGEDLEAAPPPPGQRASASKPEEDKPLRKRLFRAAGKIFHLGKKPTEEKIVPSAHNRN